MHISSGWSSLSQIWWCRPLYINKTVDNKTDKLDRPGGTFFILELIKLAMYVLNYEKSRVEARGTIQKIRFFVF